jgi:hypothetical protein
MKLIAIAAAVLLALGLSALTGCHADPQDTHIAAPVGPPR